MVASLQLSWDRVTGQRPFPSVTQVVTSLPPPFPGVQSPVTVAPATACPVESCTNTTMVAIHLLVLPFLSVEPSPPESVDIVGTAVTVTLELPLLPPPLPEPVPPPP